MKQHSAVIFIRSVCSFFSIQKIAHCGISAEKHPPQNRLHLARKCCPPHCQQDFHTVHNSHAILYILLTLFIWWLSSLRFFELLILQKDLLFNCLMWSSGSKALRDMVTSIIFWEKFPYILSVSAWNRNTVFITAVRNRISVPIIQKLCFAFIYRFDYNYIYFVLGFTLNSLW